MENADQFLRNIRTQLGKTQEQMAQYLHVEQSVYSKMEKGKSDISLTRLMKVVELTEDTAISIHEYFPQRFVSSLIRSHCQKAKTCLMLDGGIIKRAIIPFLSINNDKIYDQSTFRKKVELLDQRIDWTVVAELSEEDCPDNLAGKIKIFKAIILQAYLLLDDEALLFCINDSIVVRNFLALNKDESFSIEEIRKVRAIPKVARVIGELLEKL